ncbi:MAG TPA: hypothetical protein VFE51_04235 [Verrucomicrobiae bacterium]|nr:hypothetical protein [Verrucomicrobiae bacterium]
MSQSTEKARKARNNAAPIVIIRSRQTSLNGSGSTFARELQPIRNAKATMPAQPIKNKPNAALRPSSECQKTNAGSGNKMLPNQAGKSCRSDFLIIVSG